MVVKTDLQNVTKQQDSLHASIESTENEINRCSDSIASQQRQFTDHVKQFKDLSESFETMRNVQLPELHKSLARKTELSMFKAETESQVIKNWCDLVV